MNKKEVKSALERLEEEAANQPFYERWWSQLTLLQWVIHCHVRHVFYKMPLNVRAKNDLAREILSDIEFGYDLEMIEAKIRNGCYGNDPVHP
jgi:hypothetical protein